jgi:hypothetical protein
VAGTNIQASRKALVDRIRSLPAFEGLQVELSPPRDPMRERVWIGSKPHATQTPQAMKGSARVKRGESITVTVHIAIDEPGGTEESVGDRAVELGHALEDDLAANYRAPTVTGELAALVSAVALDTWVDDDQAHAALDYTISVDSYLT